LLAAETLIAEVARPIYLRPVPDERVEQITVASAMH